MQKLLYIDKYPVFLTLLLGLLGYQITALSKTFLESPTIEYKNTKSEFIESGVHKYEYTIQNISSTKSFRDLVINFMFDETSTAKIFSPAIVVVNPSSLHNIEFGSQDSLIVEYKIQHLQPGQKYRLLFSAVKNPGDEPRVFLTTNDTVRLVNSSISTWVVRNYIGINILLMFLWAVSVVIYVIRTSKMNI